jgi:signal transduction histidine kinase
LTSRFAPLALPRVRRVERGRALGGVAAGIGESLDVDPTLVRLVFALLAFASGAGIAAYIGAWWLLPMDGEPPPRRGRRIRGLVLLLVAGFLMLRGFGLADSVVWPVGLGAVGLALLRWRGFGLLPPVAGVALLIAAVIALVDRNSGGGEIPLIAPGGVMVGLLVVVGPWLWRLAREREAERAERIRTEERAELASRVHDSVLQTLALIQREDDPRRIATLARRQERELRGWLYPDAGRVEGESLSFALETAATEIEELHGVRVEVVRTGDRPLDDRLRALVLAAREAMANAARHSGVDEVAVFADATDGEVAVFVRDRGSGFEPEAVSPDRQGIAESIRGRMERVGGSATVIAAPGEGVEVELRLPV